MYNQYITYLKSKQRSINTIKAYTKDVETCLEYINKEEKDITLNDLLDWQYSISNSSSSTVARKTASIKNYFHYLKIVGLIPSDPAENLESVKVINKEKWALGPEQVRAMVEAANSIRSKAIIMMLANTGMRISELIDLTLDQFNDNAIIIKGKGGKYRTLFISDETRELVNEYIKVRESDYPNVFISNGGHPMQAKNISIMLKNTAKKAGIEKWEDISNHWLRTAAATMQSEAGQPIEVIQKMLGHNSIETTSRYVKIAEKRLQNAMTAQLF